MLFAAVAMSGCCGNCNKKAAAANECCNKTECCEKAECAEKAECCKKAECADKAECCGACAEKAAEAAPAEAAK